MEKVDLDFWDVSSFLGIALKGKRWLYIFGILFDGSIDFWDCYGRENMNLDFWDYHGGI